MGIPRIINSNPEQARLDRLHTLYDLAMEISASPEARKRFDLRHWLSKQSMAYPGQRRALYNTDPGFSLDNHQCVILEENSCGTAGCMIGWAATTPVFKAQGFCMRFLGGSPEPYFHDTGAKSWNAVMEFFGIDAADAHYLFLDSNYSCEATPRMVATRIKDLIEALTEGRDAWSVQ